MHIRAALELDYGRLADLSHGGHVFVHISCDLPEVIPEELQRVDEFVHVQLLARLHFSCFGASNKLLVVMLVAVHVLVFVVVVEAGLRQLLARQGDAEQFPDDLMVLAVLVLAEPFDARLDVVFDLVFVLRAAHVLIDFLSIFTE